MNKILKNIFVLIPLVFIGISCDVNRSPETAISDETFWRNADDYKSAANYFYTDLDGYPTSDNWSDDSYGRSSDPISDGSRITPATSNDYNTPYRYIRACNKLLEQAATNAAGVDVSSIKQYTAEAKFFRAFEYFSLVQKFGGVPLILKTLTDASEELFQGAATREEVVNQIYADLNDAIADLPNTSSIGSGDYGRISKQAAQGFLARVALFEGTRAKFHAYGTPDTHLQIAKNAAKAVMESGQHSLMANYFDMFQYAGEKSKENLITKVYGVDFANQVVTHNYFRSQIEQGNINPTKSLVDSYVMTDGLTIDKSPMYVKPDSSYQVFTNRDKRLLATVMKAGDAYIGSRPVFVIANPGFNTTGFCFRKFSNIDDWTSQRSTMDFPILRYAEVLLTYAEATYEMTGSISDADLDLSINLLRDRAGIAKLTNEFVSKNGLDMQTELRRERRSELAQEGLRYWDLIRWKTAETILPQEILGNYFFKDEFGNVNVTLTDDNYILVSTAAIRNFDPNKDYLWPFPLNEISLNPNLKQNPNW